MITPYPETKTLPKQTPQLQADEDNRYSKTTDTRGSSESNYKSSDSPPSSSVAKTERFRLWTMATPIQQFYPHSPEVAPPTNLASTLAVGVSQSLEISNYPAVSSHLFCFNPKKTVDRNLYAYNVGVRHFEFRKP